MEGVAYCPRRFVLDKILVDAAVAAGAELPEAFTVDDLIAVDGTVTGCWPCPRRRREPRVARYVVGAEGHHSPVASAVEAETYREREALTGRVLLVLVRLEMDGAEIHLTEGAGILAFPTNGGQVCIAAGRARAGWNEFRADIERAFFSILDGASAFSAKVRARTREVHWMGSADVANFFRKPWGPGWALVGDAGYVKDPVTGFGITDAFRDASLLSTALDAVLSGRETPEVALGRYQHRRDAAAGPIYEMTLAIAAGEMQLPGA